MTYPTKRISSRAEAGHLTFFVACERLHDGGPPDFFNSLAGLLHESRETESKFPDALCLAPRNGLGRDQFRSHADSGSTRYNEVGGRLLIDAPRRDQRNLGQGRVQRLNVLAP